MERVLHGDDIALRHDNQETAEIAKASEVVIHIKGSKTDQYNVGTTRNQYKTSSKLCPVQATVGFFRQHPQRMRGRETHLPVMRWEDGSPISRVSIQNLLALSAVATGQDPSEIGSHSLRIGGASAMYHSVSDLQAVRRFGRWASDAFHVYLWESHEQMQGISRRMALDVSELATPKEAWRRHPVQSKKDERPEEGERPGLAMGPSGQRKEGHSTNLGGVQALSVAVATQLSGCMWAPDGSHQSTSLAPTLVLMVFLVGLLLGILLASARGRHQSVPSAVAQVGSGSKAVTAGPQDARTSLATDLPAAATATTMEGVWVSVAGERWHRDRECRGLRGARGVHRVTPCSLCSRLG